MTRFNIVRMAIDTTQNRATVNLASSNPLVCLRMASRLDFNGDALVKSGLCIGRISAGWFCAVNWCFWIECNQYAGFSRSDSADLL